jgi:hypothetical protein
MRAALPGLVFPWHLRDREMWSAEERVVFISYASF